jgi:coniferyl-aldehyde dehydrogenase
VLAGGGRFLRVGPLRAHRSPGGTAPALGAEDSDCRKLVRRTTSGNVGINNTLMHVAQDDLPFGGVGPSGMGAYHGIEGFRAMSHARGVFSQGRWNLPGLLHGPFGRFAELAISMTLGRRRPPPGSTESIFG